MPKSELLQLIEGSGETSTYKRFRRILSNDGVRMLDEIPARMHDGLAHYIMKGRPVGHFLTAVLTNDLKGAFAHADDENQHIVRLYVRFFHNYVPHTSWGSKWAYEEWNRLGGLDGIEASKEAANA